MLEAIKWAQKHLTKELFCLDKSLYINYQDYLSHCDVDVRTKINKALKNDIKFSKVDIITQEHQDLYEMWTSTPIRQGRSINLKYEKLNGELYTINPHSWPYQNYSTENFEIYFVYSENKAVGYLEIVVYNDIAIVHSTVGHYNYLKFGIMKFLFAKTIEYKWGQIKYLTYGSSDSFNFFKEDLLIKNIWTPKGIIHEKSDKN